jgi:hypothetical protein
MQFVAEPRPFPAARTHWPPLWTMGHRSTGSFVAGSRLTGTVTVAPGQPSFTEGRITTVSAATGDVPAIG